MPKRLTLALLSLFFSWAPVLGQELLWELGFETLFDNRELHSEYSPDQTIFGTKLTPQVGIGWAQMHRIMAGGDFTLDFGKKNNHKNSELLLYYAFRSERLSAYTGIFKRSEALGDYPLAFFSDSVRFHNANVEGIMLQYRGRHGFAEIALDWNSMISNTQREMFQVFSSGEGVLNNFFGGYYASVYHYSSSYLETGVVDNILVQPYAGYRKGWVKGRRFMSLHGRVGWLQAVQRDRRFDDDYRTPGGAVIDLGFRWHTLGMDNSLYIGDGLMPLYGRYGPDLYTGDQYYRTDEGLYNRLEAYWEPVSNQIFFLRLSTVHHYDGKNWGSQQLIRFTINLNRANTYGR